jgi:hypothetical protein
MDSEYCAKDVEQMREYLIKLRNKCLGEKFDAEGAITLSHIINLLSEVLKAQETTDEHTEKCG